MTVAIYLRGTELSRLRQRAECEAFAAVHYPGGPVEAYDEGEATAGTRSWPASSPTWRRAPGRRDRGRHHPADAAPGAAVRAGAARRGGAMLHGVHGGDFDLWTRTTARRSPCSPSRWPSATPGCVMSEASPFPDETPVLVRYPRTEAEAQGDREAWPWLPGTVLQQVGPDEWQVCVEVPELAEAEGGELWYPCCFRDAGELRLREHLGATISAPGDGGYSEWIARQDGMIVASAGELDELLGILERLRPS